MALRPHAPTPSQSQESSPLVSRESPQQDVPTARESVPKEQETSTFTPPPISSTSPSSTVPREKVAALQEETLLTSPTATTTTTASTAPPPHKHYAWRPKIWRAQPVLGLFAFATAITCVILSLIVLQISAGREVTSWPLQPSVYLAIATAVSNAALQAALVQSTPIYWWYKALRGSTVRDLELSFEATQSFLRAFLRSVRHKQVFCLFSVAGLATALVLIDGPLLQRATRVVRTSTETSLPIELAIAPQLPQGFSGGIDWFGSYFVTPAAASLLRAYRDRTPIELSNATECSGSCRARVRAPGLAKMHCSHESWDITEDMLRDASSTWGPLDRNPSDVTEHPLIWSYVNPTWLDGTICEGGREALSIMTGIANYQDCEGAFTWTNCTMLPAVLEYDVTIEGQVLSIDSTQRANPLVALANGTCEPRPQGMGLYEFEHTSMLALALALVPYFFANASLGRVLYDADEPRPYPVETPRIESFNAFSLDYVEWGLGRDSCTVVSRDPMDDIITSFNEILFRAGVMVATWSNVTAVGDSNYPAHQQVSADNFKDQNVFQTDLRWFFGAAALQFLTILLILPGYWGWWDLGVDLSLSPFHTAKTLQTPLFQNVDAAGDVGKAIDEIGDIKVKLGVVEIEPTAASSCRCLCAKEAPQLRLTIAEAAQVSKPMRDMGSLL